MTNPYKKLREAAGATIRGFAAEVEVQPSVIQAVEAGLYTTVPLRLNKALGKLCYDMGVDVLEQLAPFDSLDAAYRDWQHQQRVRFRGQFITYPEEPLPGEAVSPMQKIREANGPGLKTFCSKLKVPLATVMRYEQGLTTKMPSALHAALAEVSYPHGMRLRGVQERWRLDDARR